MKKRFAVLLVVCLVSACVPETTSWLREDKTDPLRGTSYAQFLITGKFLTPPKTANSDTPSFVVKCIPGGHKRVSGGYINGKLLDAYMNVHAVLDRTPRGHVVVQYRLDDGKMHTENWNVGTDGTAVFLPEIELNTVLYGHFLPHKEGTNPPTRKVVIGVDEYMGTEVVMQFDLPDPTEMADACGVLIRKN